MYNNTAEEINLNEITPEKLITNFETDTEISYSILKNTAQGQLWYSLFYQDHKLHMKNVYYIDHRC
jgi:hypothetical protein